MILKSRELNEYEKLLVRAMGKIYPHIFYCNLTKDYYQLIENPGETTPTTKSSGSYEEFINNQALRIPAGQYRTDFTKTFSAENLLSLSKISDSIVEFNHPQLNLNNEMHWFETRVMFVPGRNNEVQFLFLKRYIDEKIQSEQGKKHYQELLSFLAEEYANAYSINLDLDTATPYNVTSKVKTALNTDFVSSIRYSTNVVKYAEHGVDKEDRKNFIEYLSKDYIVCQLTKKDRFTRNFLNEKGLYCEMKCVKTGDWSKQKTVVLGFAEKDKDIRKELIYQKELKDAKENAEKANEAKSEFLARMSHDIRTPINGVIGMTELAKKNIDNPEKIKACLNNVTSSSYHLLNIINDILDMSHIEQNKIEISHSPMNIFSFADGCLSLLEGQLTNRKLNVISELQHYDFPYVLGDEIHLRQSIINILNNAVKYTPDGGKIIFRINQLASGDKTVTYRFEVEDNGRGIKKEFLDHIWDAFSHEGDETSEDEGSGLGLAITKSLVELMGGTISAKSEINKGTTITIDMSFAIDDVTAARVKAEDKNEAKNLNGSRILLVEDNEINRESEKELLEAEGAIVKTALNGKEAVHIFEKSKLNSFDAILMDIIMPEMNGLDATRIIRGLNRADAGTIPIIALTANAFNEDVRNSLAAGMNAHLSKPLKISKVISTLLNCIRVRSLEQAETLSKAITLANKDALTGVSNRTAYEQMVNKINQEIVSEDNLEFGVIICDVNNLKRTNDSFGHAEGDKLIIKACSTICEQFKHSPVYRVGGDEFIILLKGSDYKNRENIISDFQEKMKMNGRQKLFSIASGISDFNKKEDKTFATVLERADAKMYINKREIKDL